MGAETRGSRARLVYYTIVMRQRPAPPQLRLPRSDKPFFGGTATSIVVHGAIVLFVILGGRAGGELFIAGGGPGPAGGGGGGGGSRVSYVEIPPYIAAAAPARKAPTNERAIELPIPKPRLKEIRKDAPKVKIAQPTGPVVIASKIGVGDGSGGGPGSGTGSGGGTGTGEGAGTGSGQGPGTGGEGGAGYGPQSRQMLLPPDAPESIKGQEFRVRFWINERGKVTKVDVEPRIRDSDYRKRFMEKMSQFTFHPARLPDGTPVASHYDVLITP